MEKRLRFSLHSSPDEFLSIATKLNPKSSKPTLKNLIYSIKPSSDLCISLPLSIHHSISQCIHSFQSISENSTYPKPKSPRTPPIKRLRRSSRRSKNRAEVDEGDCESNVDQEKQRVLENLQVLAHVSLLCLSHPKKAFSAEVLLPGVRELQDHLILFEADSALLSVIASLCEVWWKENLPGREMLISQSLPFLVSRSLTLKKKADVHRVYAFREAFSLFDFEDESIEDLKLLLIRCVIEPLYLKTEEGRRFVAFMFGLSGQLVKEALAMIRAQIPYGRKSLLEAYGDILFRAWKVAEGNLKEEIENGFLQGLIEGAISASSGVLASSIRRVLGGFINQRTIEGVEKLLFRIAEPVVFRSLQVANSNVRQNALLLLLDLFPLEDPDANKEVKDTLLDKQFYLLERLLMDDCPDVRVVAVEGTCRILRLFWEIIPSPTIAKLITKLFDDMSHDICNEVRLSTLNGIMYLLGNPQSHEILKVLLPRLGHLIVDNVVSIRVAVADLLLLLRDSRTFQFNKVVGLDVLLSVLANDQPQIAKKITKLLIPSYFPSKLTPEEACNRCVILTKRSQLAGARFCEFAASEGASLKSLMELVRAFITLVLSLDKQDADQIEGLLGAAEHLCNNLVSEPFYKSSLEDFFSGEKVRCLFAAASTTRARSSVFNIAIIISPDDVAELLEECMGLVTNCSGLTESVERQALVRSAHKLLLSCDAFDDMFDALTRILEKTSYRCSVKFSTETPKQSVLSVKRKKSKSIKISDKWKRVGGKKPSTFEEDYNLSLAIAWQIRDMVMSEDSRKAMLASQSLEQAFHALRVISEVSIVQSMHSNYMDTSPVLAYTALSLHTSLQNISITSTHHDGSKKNNGSNSSTSSLETLDHLLHCAERLLRAGDSGKAKDIPSVCDNKKIRKKHGEPQTAANNRGDDGGSIYPNYEMMLPKVKMLTVILKFIVEAATMDLVSQNEAGCLKFMSAYVRYVISYFGQQSSEPINKDMKEILLCLKSSLTYAAKLLHLLTSLAPLEAFDLANELLNLITSIELFLGAGYTGHLVSALKPWLPDLILALGGHILHVQGDRTSATPYARITQHLPTWLVVLAESGLREMNEDADEEDTSVSEPEEFTAFMKLMEMIISLLRGTRNVLDAVGVIFMTGTLVGLERKDFRLVLGLLYFVRVKLLGREDREWIKLDIMLASLQDMYPRIEREIEEEGNEDHKQKLNDARALIEPVWMYHLYETGKFSEMEE